MKIFDGKSEHEIRGIKHCDFTGAVLPHSDYRDLLQFRAEMQKMRDRERILPFIDPNLPPPKKP